MTDNVTPFPTNPAPREYTITYTKNAWKDEELVTKTATGYLVELGVFTGISEDSGATAGSQVIAMIPTMNIALIESKAVETVN